LISQVLKVAVMFVSTVILARLLSPEEFGLVAMVLAIFGVGEIFRDFGLSMAALQAKKLSHAQQSNLFWINAIVGLCLSLIFFLAAAPISIFFERPELVEAGQVLCLTFLLGGLTTQFKVVINRQLRFVSLAITDLVPYVSGAAAAIVVGALTASYWALVAQQLIIAAGTLILAVCLSGWRPSLPSKAPMRELVSFGASFAGTQFVSYISRNVDSVMIGKFWGSVSLGYYDRAYNLVVLPLTQINTPMSRVAVPVLARTQTEDERYVAYLRRAQLVALYVTSTIFALLAGLAEPLVLLLLGPQWQASAMLLSILAISGVFRSLVQVAYWVYVSRGLAAVQFRFYLVAQPILVCIILAGVPFGAVGVATAVAIGYALFWVASLAWVKRASGLPLGVLYLDAFRAIFLLAAPIAGVSALASHMKVVGGLPEVIQLIAGLGAALVWCIGVTLASRRVRGDLKMLVDFLKRAVVRNK